MTSPPDLRYGGVFRGLREIVRERVPFVMPLDDPADEGAVAPRDLSTMVAVDFEADDPPERCTWCPAWRFEWVDLEEGHTVLREWHLTNCPVAKKWGLDVE